MQIARGYLRSSYANAEADTSEDGKIDLDEFKAREFLSKPKAFSTDIMSSRQTKGLETGLHKPCRQELCSQRCCLHTHSILTPFAFFATPGRYFALFARTANYKRADVMFRCHE